MFLIHTNNQIKKRTTTISITASIFVSLFLSSVIASPSIYTAYGSSSDVGFQDGLSDCRSGTSDAINGHSNAGHHSAAYMNAYNQGLTSCNNSGINNDASPQQNPPSNLDSNGGILFLGNNINLFTICEKQIMKIFITHPCSQLITSDGHSLTQEGVNLLGCLGLKALTLAYGQVIAEKIISAAVGC